MQRVLRAIGAFSVNEVETVAQAIYTSAVFSDNAYHFTLACFGEAVNSEISENFPDVPQILWDQVFTFIYNRFRKYRDQKSSHGQWEKAGRDLWDCVWHTQDPQDFKDAVEILV